MVLGPGAVDRPGIVHTGAPTRCRARGRALDAAHCVHKAAANFTDISEYGGRRDYLTRR